MTVVTDEDQAAIEAHNTRSMWAEAADHLEAAKNCLENAQGLMEDLDVPRISENLKPTVEAVERFRVLAADKAIE